MLKILHTYAVISRADCAIVYKGKKKWKVDFTQTNCKVELWKWAVRGNSQVFDKSKGFEKVGCVFQSIENGKWAIIEGKQAVSAQQ